MSCAQKLKDRINDIITTKKTNLIFSADIVSYDGKIHAANVLSIIDVLGDVLLGVKLHSDIIELKPETHDSCEACDFYVNLRILAEKHNFLVIEDRKLCDIGSTMRLQSEPITRYADLVTVHGLTGSLDGLVANCEQNNCGILLIAQMSCAGNLIDRDYTTKVVGLAKTYSNVVVGFIAQEQLDPNFLTFTPGVSLDTAGDSLGQQYNTPKYLVKQKRVDALIVGRAICKSIGATDYSCPDTENSESRTDLCNAAKSYIYTKTQALVDSFYEMGIVKKGDFTLKSGAKSSVYVDCRLLMKYPKFYYEVGKLISSLIDPELDASCIAGVPMGAIPLATIVSSASGMPMIMVRDSVKTYGMQQLIEGSDTIVNANEPRKCILIEDVLTTGGSVIETIVKLESNGYKVTQVLAILDREQGAVTTIARAGYPVKTLLTLSSLL